MKDAVAALTTTVEFKTRTMQRLRDAGVDWAVVEQVAENVIGDLFKTDIPRPELVVAYNSLSSQGEHREHRKRKTGSRPR